MDKIWKKANPVVGVVLSANNPNVATADLQIGPRYHGILLEVVATAANGKILTIADVLALINVKINGKVVRAHTAYELDFINKQYGSRFGANAYNYAGGKLSYIGLNYTGGAGLATQRIVGAGNNDLTVTPTLVNGSPTALAIVAGGTAYKVGDQFSITDATGTGAVGLVTTVAGGAVTAATVSVPGYSYVNQPIQAPIAGAQTVFYIPIYFSEPWRKTYSASQFFAWPTVWQNGATLDSFQLELTIPTASANINTGQPFAITAYYASDALQGGLDAQKNPVRNVTRWERTTIPYTGAGDLYIVNEPKRDILLEQTFFCPAGDDITNMQVTVNSAIKRNVSKNVNDQSLVENEYNPFALHPDVFALCWDYSDDPTDGLVLSANGQPVSEYTLIATLGAAAATNKYITSIRQVYGPIQ